ncbi:hypothetical protein [Streptomyces sp. NPDC001502]
MPIPYPSGQAERGAGRRRVLKVTAFELRKNLPVLWPQLSVYVTRGGAA